MLAVETVKASSRSGYSIESYRSGFLRTTLTRLCLMQDLSSNDKAILKRISEVTAALSK